MAAQEQRVVVITGLTGAGRSTAADALEDAGWYVVDNLPPRLLPDLVRLLGGAGIYRLAIVLDVRGRVLFRDLLPALEELRSSEIQVEPEVLFLEASDEIIIRRQESARRPHPLQAGGRLLDGVRAEREQMSALRSVADQVIDTTNLNVHQLRDRVGHAYGGPERRFRASIVSFGFKHGVPIDADLVLDVRFLPNPHWIPELRPMTGMDQPVRDYVLGQDGAVDYLDRVESLLTEVVIPGYTKEGKWLMTIAIGCTGGRHRSTSMAIDLGRRLEEHGVPTSIVHRDAELV
ncbi:RNase adapter RapZ [Raineyella antarctica]|uniref:RNase adapter RapZ n=1 Tax=Raineyella antarctica TaxID=1577474 RepID=UPI000B825F6A|nr:RNase adapter RapZ [Raineyella antarctica]